MLSSNHMLFLLKIFLVPAAILLLSLAGRKWGPAVSGTLAGLPVIVAPILLFLGIDQGLDFAMRSTNGALSGASSLAIFCFVYAWSSTCFGVARSLVLSISTFALCTYVFWAFPCPTLLTFAFNIILIIVLIKLLPNESTAKASYNIPRHEIICRMIAAALLVIVLTSSATVLGPRLSGLLPPFPIAGTVLAGFTHTYYGHGATLKLLRGFILGLIAMSVFAYSLLTVTPLFGFVLSFGLSIILSLIVGATITIHSTKLSPYLYK